MMEGVNSTMIYCKNFVNVTMYPQYKDNKKKRKENVPPKSQHKSLCIKNICTL
jgi:hypothetical protein